MTLADPRQGAGEGGGAELSSSELGAASPPLLRRLFRATEYLPNGCWQWTAYLGRDGYGQVRVGSTKDGSRRKVWLHRLAYALLVGPIPAGMQIDHLCRNRGCWNPAHLEVVTSRENTLRGMGTAAQRARQTECQWGHPFDASNTYVRPGTTRRECRTCRREARHG